MVLDCRSVTPLNIVTSLAHLGWQPVLGEFALFAVDIDDVTYIGHDAASNAQHVACWPAGEEYLRPS